MLTSNRFESLIAHESLCRSLFDFKKNFCTSVTETVLNKDDIPWEVLKRRGFESVRLMVSTYFLWICLAYNLSVSSAILLRIFSFLIITIALPGCHKIIKRKNDK